jgi:two-component system nitrate/nitrite response regulator NarL
MQERKSGTTQVSLVVRDELVRYGLERMLQAIDLVDEIRVRDSIDSACRVAPVESPHVVIVSLREMKPRDEQAVEMLRERGTKILLLFDGDEQQLNRAVRLGGSGFLHPHDLSTASLHEALHQACVDGEVPVPPTLAAQLLAKAREEAIGQVSRRPAGVRMTPRERQVLALLVEGMSNKEIARKLGISGHGVKRLVACILAKLDCPNRTLAVAKALRDRVIEEDG